jgi:glycosyltransferase involved in cell wall biosynthesis
MKSDDILISFIVPMLNAEKTISITLQSIYNQVNPPSFEVIVVDNGSSDHSISLVNAFPCKLIHEKKKGAGVARNKGLEVASGKYVAFIDSDVRLEDNWLSESLKVLEGSIFVGTQGPIIPMSLGRESLLQSFRLKYNKLTTNGTFNHLHVDHAHPIINTAACFYRLDWVKKAHGFDPNLQRCEDGDLTKKILALGGHFRVSQARAYVYWDKSLWSYILRFIPIGKYHVILKRLWSEDFKIQFSLKNKAAQETLTFKELILFYLIRLSQNLGNSIGLMSDIRFFGARESYFRDQKENFLILNLTDEKGKNYTLAPWVRILSNYHGYIFLDLKARKCVKLPQAQAAFLEKYLTCHHLTPQETQELIFFFKERLLFL